MFLLPREANNRCLSIALDRIGTHGFQRDLGNLASERCAGLNQAREILLITPGERVANNRGHRNLAKRCPRGPTGLLASLVNKRDDLPDQHQFLP